MVLRDSAAADERTWLATIDTVAVHPDHRQRGERRVRTSATCWRCGNQLLDDGHLTGRIVLTTD
jgi:hypothetical protein